MMMAWPGSTNSNAALAIARFSARVPARSQGTPGTAAAANRPSTGRPLISQVIAPPRTAVSSPIW